MAIIKQRQLLNYATSLEFSESARRSVKVASSAFTKTVFLSHSHKDKLLVEGLKNLLGSMGVELYIDWLDDNMPAVTSRETAEKLKNRIKSCNLFMLLATTNALNSKWVPWEIGIADGVKSLAQIVLVPVADDSGSFPGSEYLQIYNKLETDPSLAPFITSPNGINQDKLSNLLRRL